MTYNVEMMINAIGLEHVGFWDHNDFTAEAIMHIKLLVGAPLSVLESLLLMPSQSCSIFECLSCSTLMSF